MTGDLRTLNNELSLWKLPSTEAAELDKAAVALAAAGHCIDRLDVAWVAEEDLRARGVSLQDSLGNTPAVAFRDLHVDAEKLDLTGLSAIAQLLARAIRERDQFRRYTKAQVRSLLQASLAAGQIDRSLVDPRLGAELRV